MTDLFNPTTYEAWCWIDVYPHDCFVDEEIECIRGNVGALYMGNMIVFTVMLLSLLCVLLCMIIIIIGVCRDNLNLETIDSNRSHRDQRSKLFTKERLKILLVKQAILYMCAFLLTWIFPIIYIATQNNNIFSVLTLIFWPLQGFFNALIFIHNKVYNIKQHGKSITTCDALNLIFIHPGKMPEIYLSDLRRVEFHHYRAEWTRDEFVARTENKNEDDYGSNEVAFSMSVREEVSLIFDDLSSLMNRKHPGNNDDNHVAASFQDVQIQSVRQLSEPGEVCESNDKELIGIFHTNSSLEENDPTSLSEDFNSKDETFSSKFKQTPLSNPNLSVDFDGS